MAFEFQYCSFERISQKDVVQFHSFHLMFIISTPQLNKTV